ncbi:MAG: EthD domain-containing protein, partial [Pseudomonadota bacterium]
DALTRAAFHDYWLNRHAQIGRRLIPPFTYHQLHADAALTQRAATTSGLTPSDYDGIVEVHFPDTDALIRQLSRTEVAQEALEDEKNFIDHARSRFWAFREDV